MKDAELKPCPKCGRVPRLSYVCGEFFVVGGSDCPMCGGGLRKCTLPKNKNRTRGTGGLTMTVLKHCPNCGAKMDESEDKNEIF